MRKNLGAKEILCPMPVLIIGTYDENGTPNAMTVAWGAISGKKEISLYIYDKHKTAANIVRAGAFTVAFADVENIVACDYVGIVSGNNVPNKIANTGWHTIKSEFVNAPLFEEFPLALECKVLSYEKETCRLVGEIVIVCADERILDENNKVDLEKFCPVAYDPMQLAYRKIGDVGGGAYSIGAKLT